MNTTLTNEVRRRVVAGRVDLYRDIHKGLRHALFDLTFHAGRLDPADDELVGSLVGESRRVIGLLRGHSDHEEQPAVEAVIETHATAFASAIRDQHHAVAERLEWLASRADELASAPRAARVPIAHAFYLELAAFTSAYLGHLDVEERIVMPALTAQCDDAELGAVAQAIVASIRPEQQAVGLGAMLPALTPSERVELLQRIRAGASHAAFAGVCAIAAAVLTTGEYADLDLGRTS